MDVGVPQPQFRSVFPAFCSPSCSGWLYSPLPRRVAGRRAPPPGLVVIALLTLVQAVPAPRAVVNALSPHAEAVRLAFTLGRSARAGMVSPLSIHEYQATAWASLVAIRAIALFFAARAYVRFRRRPAYSPRNQRPRGSAVSGVAVAQAATAGRPGSTGTSPRSTRDRCRSARS